MRVPQVEVNYLAVLVAAIISLVIGFLWYGPFFGRRWMQLANVTPGQITSGAMARTTAGAFIGALILYYVLALVVDWTGATTASGGVAAGFLMWLGFAATVTFNSVLYESRPTALWALNNGYQLATMLIAGVLLAVWP